MFGQGVDIGCGNLTATIETTIAVSQIIDQKNTMLGRDASFAAAGCGLL
ncbi:MAG: hypothetical protein R3C99_26800 [Pirellulaceae bacterium]